MLTKKLSTLFATLVCLLICAPMATSVAQGKPPALRVESTSELVPLSSISSGYNLQSNAYVFAPHEMIESLALRLEHDPDRLYEYVYNKIELVPAFGVQKGGLGAFLNESGTAFDQAELLNELLRASQIQTKYIFGSVSLNSTETLSLFGTDSRNAVESILANGGIPGSVSGDGASISVQMAHVWIAAYIDGAWHQFDPAMKTHDVFGGSDLSALSGISVASVESSTFGQAIQSSANNIPSLSNVNRAGFTQLLDTYAQNFETATSTSQYQNQSSISVLGGKAISPKINQTTRLSSLPYSTGTIAEWTADIPDDFRVEVTLTACSTLQYFVDHSIRIQLTSVDQIDPVSGNVLFAGDMPSSVQNHVEIKQDRQVDLTSCASTVQSKYAPIDVVIDHPYLASSGTYADGHYSMNTNIAGRGPGQSSDGSSPYWDIVRVNLGNTDFKFGDTIRRQYANTGNNDVLIPGANYTPPDNTFEDVAVLGDFFARQSAIRNETANALRQNVIHHHSVAFLGNLWAVIDWDSGDWSPPYQTTYSFEGVSLRVVNLSSRVSVSDLTGDLNRARAAGKVIGSLSAAFENLAGLNFVHRLSPADLMDTHLEQGVSGQIVTINSSNLTQSLNALIGYDQFVENVIAQYIAEGYEIVAPITRVNHRAFHDWNGTVISSSGGTLAPPMQPQTVFGFDTNGGFVAIVADTVSGDEFVIKGGAGNLAQDGIDQIGVPSHLADALNDSLLSAGSLISVNPESGLPTVNVSAAISQGPVGSLMELSEGYFGESRSQSLVSSTGAVGIVSLGQTQNQLEIGYDLSLQLGKRSPRDGAQFVAAAITMHEYFLSNQTSGKEAAIAALASVWLLDEWRDGVVTVSETDRGALQFVRSVTGNWIGPPRTALQMTQTGSPTYVPPHNKLGYHGVEFTLIEESGWTKKFSHQNVRNVGSSYAQPGDCVANQVSVNELLNRERVFWGIEPVMPLVQESSPFGFQRTWAFTHDINCTALPSKVSNSAGWELNFPVREGGVFSYQTGSGLTAYRADSLLVRPVPGLDPGTLGPCVMDTNGQVTFAKTLVAPDGTLLCTSGAKVVSLHSRGNELILWADATNCDVAGYYGAGAPSALRPNGVTTSWCEYQNYYFGADMAPILRVQMDTHSPSALSAMDGEGHETLYRVAPTYSSLMIDPLGNRDSSFYDNRDRLVISIDADSRVTHRLYNDADQIVEVRKYYEAAGYSTYFERETFTYDAIGNVVSRTSHPRTDGSFHPGPQNVASYDQYNDSRFPRQKTKETDALGYSTTYAYDSQGRLITRIGPFLDDLNRTSAGDPSCDASIQVPCETHEYLGPLGQLSKTRIKSENGWRVITREYGTAAEKYVVLRQIETVE